MAKDSAEAKRLITRLREKGDFKDEEGTWTLDTTGYPTVIRERKG